MGQSRRWLTFWAKDILSIATWMCSTFSRTSILTWSSGGSRSQIP
jgi:hypothetical protein